MTIPAVISKLIPRLGSDFEGEVVATAAAIRRALAAEGLDLHDLVTSIGKPGIDNADMHGWMKAAVTSIWLTPWERRFAASLRGYEPEDLSPKQARHVARIISILRRRGERP